MVKPLKKTMLKKKKVLREISQGRIYIYSSFNNTLISITDAQGNTLSFASAGSSGFKGARRSTPYAAQLTMKNALEKAKGYGLKEVQIFVSGVGPGREQAVRGIQGSGLMVTSIRDITSIPHGGCRSKKPRRV